MIHIREFESNYLLLKREHWSTPLTQIIFLNIISIIVCTASYSLVYSFPFPFLIVLWLVVIAITLGFMSIIIINWYFHAYIIAWEKIIETRYFLLFSQKTKIIFLNQVRCIDINKKSTGLISTVLGVEDITLTFDGFTTQSEFIFKNIDNDSQVMHVLNLLFGASQVLSAHDTSLGRREVNTLSYL